MSTEAADEAGPDPVATVAAWRARGAGRADPVGFGVIEALARRAAAQKGLARQLMLRRVDALLAGLAAAQPAGPRALPGPDERTRRRAALAGLAGLVDRLGRLPGPVQPPGAAPPAASTPATAPASLKAVTAFKGTWARLRAEQRLRQTLDQVPAMAGPLNSSQVVSRALQTMHGLSPAYLDAFMSHIDTLLWLEQASGTGDLAPRPASAPEGRARAGGRVARKG